MANRQTQSEREYQDSLKITQSMLGEISRAMADTANSADGRNRALEQQIDITRDILHNIKDVKDYEKTINYLLTQQTQINKTNYGINERLRQVQLAQLDAALGIVKAGEDTEKVFGRVNDIASETADKFSSGLDDILDKIGEIPLIGGALKNVFQPFADKSKLIINETAEKFTKGFKNAFGSARVGGASFTKSLGQGLKGGLQGMKSMIGMAGRLLAAINPVVLIIGAIALAAYAGFQRFQELDSAAKRFREETGLLNSQTLGIRDNIKSVSTDMAGLGASTEEVASAAIAFTNELAPTEQISKATLGSMVALNKNFGIGVQEGAQLNKIFQNIGGLSQEQSQALIGQTAQMAKMAGVAPDKVIKDMAENSEYAYRYFNGSPEGLAKAAVQAAKLGTSIKQAGEMADGLLDFENSITAELEASALLGTNLNLSQARYLAANNDILGAQQAVLDQVSNLGDLTKLNRYEQEALTKATGMEMGDLINQQRIRERFGSLNSEQLKAANSLVESGKDISKMSAKDLDLQTQRLKSQEEMQSQMDKIQNTSSAIGTAFMDMFEPVTSFVMPILSDLFTILSKALLPTFKVIGIVFKVVFGTLKAIYDVISSIVMPIIEIASAVVDAIITPFEMALDAIQPFFNAVASLKTTTMEMVGPILNFFKSIGQFIGDYIINPIDAITSRIASMSGIFSSIASFFGGGDETDTTTTQTSIPAINDGIVQNGKVVSTNPADTLIATKNPNGLAGQVGGGIDISALVNKMDEMIQAVSANRDVYMDREKVSSSVVRTSEKSSQNRFGLMGA
jgi:hypothetical protein